MPLRGTTLKRVRRIEFKSDFCNLVSVEPGIHHFTTVGLSFFTCKMEMTVLPNILGFLRLDYFVNKKLSTDRTGMCNNFYMHGTLAHCITL